MKSIQYLLSEYLKKNGIKISFVAKAAGIKYELLRRSLNGNRVLTADELTAILTATNITLADILNIDNTHTS